MPLFCSKLLRDSNKNLEHLFGGWKPIKYIFVFTPSVGVKHFWVDLNGRLVFVPIPSVRVVYIWVVRT